MWTRIKAICKGIKDFIVGLFQNAANNVQKAIDALGWFSIPLAALSIYILMMLPQLAVFAVIASFTSGVPDPVLKFIASIFVFTAMEFVLMTGAWIAVIILGLPEMLRFFTYVYQTYQRRVAEEEIRESEGRNMSLKEAYENLKNHQVPEPQGI